MYLHNMNTSGTRFFALYYISLWIIELKDIVQISET